MKQKIAIVGLGYVWLPLAYNFAIKEDLYDVIWYDISETKISQLQSGFDDTDEIWDAIQHAKIHYTTTIAELSDRDIIIVTVPTPIDSFHKPDITPLLSASKNIWSILQKGQIVVYESTVYPGCTEEDCIPVLEANSWLVYNKDFYVWYSPERINPGDKVHTVDKITKVVAWSTPETAQKLAALYGSINNNNIHLAPSIAVAEAAKVIENTQRDVNIALMNELTLIFHAMWLRTSDVLKAAGTKWNFLPFFPGLVGGHCIGIDPYYLAAKAYSVWYSPDMILAARRVNESIAGYVANQIIALLFGAGKWRGSKVLIAWLTFKPNVPDFRNSKIADTIAELQKHGVDVFWFDPHSEKLTAHTLKELSLSKDHVVDSLEGHIFDAIVYAQDHDAFKQIAREQYLEAPSIMFDIPSALPEWRFAIHKTL